MEAKAAGRRAEGRAGRRRKAWGTALVGAALACLLAGGGGARPVRPAPAVPHPVLYLSRMWLPLAPGTPPPAVSARAAALLWGDRTLYRLRAQLPLPLASTAKIMTAYLALRHLSLDRTVTVTPAMVRLTRQQAAEGGLEAPVFSGLRLTVRQLLVALLLPSANNAASALAQAVSGSQGRFIALMNRTARQLGLATARFADPSGLDPATRMGALDLARLTRRALGLPAFAALIGMPRGYVPGWGTVVTLNRLLGVDPLVVGGKTGYTQAAGYCLVLVGRVGGRTAVAVLLDEPSWSAAFGDGRRLLSWAKARTAPQLLLPAGMVVGAAWRHGVRHPLELVRPLEGPGTARLEEARLSLGPWVGGTGSGTARPAALLTVWAAGRPWGAAPVAVGPPLG